MLPIKQPEGVTMFCNQCGESLATNHKFCAKCGTPVAHADTVTEKKSGWHNDKNVRAVLNNPEVIRLIENAKGSHDQGLSAKEFFKDVAPFMKAVNVGKQPLETMSEIVPAWYSALGIKSGSSSKHSTSLSIGRVIAAAACSLASRNMPLIDAAQASDGVILKGKIGSSIWTFGGEMIVTLSETNIGTEIEAVVVIPGQFFDWGASKDYITNLFTDVDQYARLQPMA